MQIGTKIIFPCFIDGCGLFTGDVHYAQGDGEVSGTAIEMGAINVLRTRIIKGGGKNMDMPVTVGNDQIRDMEPTRYYQTVGIPLKGKGEQLPSHGYLNSEKITNFKGETFKTPVFNFEKYKIWGLTLAFTINFLDLLDIKFDYDL